LGLAVFPELDSRLKWQRLKPDQTFVRMIEAHREGIAAFCKPENKVSLGFVEGLNYKIRVIQRRACGLRDKEHLRLNILRCMLPAFRSLLALLSLHGERCPPHPLGFFPFPSNPQEAGLGGRSRPSLRCSSPPRRSGCFPAEPYPPAGRSAVYPLMPLCQA
jgi:hypothetical protein